MSFYLFLRYREKSRGNLIFLKSENLEDAKKEALELKLYLDHGDEDYAYENWIDFFDENVRKSTICEALLLNITDIFNLKDNVLSSKKLKEELLKAEKEEIEKQVRYEKYLELKKEFEND